MSEFDLHEHRRIRNRELEQHVAFLEGERDRLELLLTTLLRLGARTVGCTETLILDTLITITGIDPCKAHIHEAPFPVPSETKADDLAA